MPITTADPNPPTIEPASSRIQNSLPPRRTVHRLVLALAGVGMGLLGQIFFNRSSLWDGLLFYGIAAILFVRALADHLYPNYKFSLPSPQLTGTLTIHQGWRRLVGIWLMLLAVGVSIFDYRLFGNDDARMQGLAIHCIEHADDYDQVSFDIMRDCAQLCQ